METKIQNRRGTAAEWTAADPVLLAGEIGFETDTYQLKIGNGSDSWSALDYFEAPDSAAGSFIESSEKGANDGVATLDSTGNVPASQLGNAPDPDLSGYATESYADTVEADAISASNQYTDSLIGDGTVDGTSGNTVTDRINTAISNLIDNADVNLDTLNELANAINNDDNFSTTITNLINGKADASHTHAISDVTNLQAELDSKQTEVVTTEGDLIVGNASGDSSRLGIGSIDQVLTSNGTTAVWADAPEGSGGTVSDATPSVAGAVLGYTSEAGNSVETVALGNGAGAAAISGSAVENVFVGEGAGENSTGDDNVIIGQNAGRSVFSDDNVIIGSSAAFSGPTGNGNVIIGQSSSGGSNSGNVIIGQFAGSNANNAINSVAIGRFATVGEDADNCVAIGEFATTSSSTATNEITLGASNITTLRCATGSITTFSDARDKKNIEDLGVGLNLINELRPVKFDWHMRDEGKIDQPDSGFIAQDIIEAEDRLGVHDFLKLSMRGNEERYEVSAARLIPVLVNAVKELSAEVESLKAQIADN